MEAPALRLRGMEAAALRLRGVEATVSEDVAAFPQRYI